MQCPQRRACFSVNYCNSFCLPLHTEMNNLKIILMLSAIIPSLNGCSSRTLRHGRSIDFFRAAEPLSNNSHATSASLHSNASKIGKPQQSTPIAIINSNEPPTLSHKHQYLPDHSEAKSDLDSNEDDAHVGPFHYASLSNVTNNTSINVRNDDVHYRIMDEIVSIECVEWFRWEFCLNGGRCFLYPILNQSLSSCECAEGYVGERCEVKSYEFIPRIRPRTVLAETIGGPFIFGLAAIDVIFFLFLLCKMCYRD